MSFFNAMLSRVQLFYENKLFFGYCCVGAEFFYIFLYTVSCWFGVQRADS